MVLKRQTAGGDGSSTQSAWYPVSGDPIEGWQVADSTNLTAVLAAARANPYLFVLDSSGAHKDTLENLPGDILTYYHVLASNGKLTADNAQYTVGFYRTSAASLADATPENTVRLNDGASINGQNFDREFAVRLYVPDIKNYLFVQKISEDGYTPLSGAGFALYKASDVTDGAVNPGAQPFDTVTTRNQSQNQGDVITLGGAGVFPNTQAVLPAGTYYLKELQAPAGYAPSGDLTEVIVDNTDVYANAGTVDDDITVLRGVGKIVRSMLQFAVPDDINATLTDIQAALYTAPLLHAGHRQRLGGLDSLRPDAAGSLLLPEQPDPGIRPHHPRGPRLFCRAVRLVPSADHPRNYAARHRPGPEDQPGRPEREQRLCPQHHRAGAQPVHPAGAAKNRSPGRWER